MVTQLHVRAFARYDRECDGLSFARRVVQTEHRASVGVQSFREELLQNRTVVFSSLTFKGLVVRNYRGSFVAVIFVSLGRGRPLVFLRHFLNRLFDSFPYRLLYGRFYFFLFERLFACSQNHSLDGPLQRRR